jgi:GMP synthase (glutamine-hydrolysing)
MGQQLELPDDMVFKHPFPGPGLAVRCLCSKDDLSTAPGEEARRVVHGAFGLDATVTPLRSVGVQGDYRSYSNLVVLSGDADLQTYGKAATRLTSEMRAANRVAFLVASRGGRNLACAHVRKAFVTGARLDLLREADAIAQDMLKRAGLSKSVWQFPVILLPLSFGTGETVGLRPVFSTDAMTARYADLPMEFIRRLGDALLALSGVDAVLYDVTNKPPATIEWE